MYASIPASSLGYVQQLQGAHLSYEVAKDALRQLYRVASREDWLRLASQTLRQFDSRIPRDPEQYARDWDGDIWRLLFSDPQGVRPAFGWAAHHE